MICRFTSFVFAYLTASAVANPFAPAQSKNDGKAAYMSKLVRKATPTANSQLRNLEDAFEIDLTPYSLKFMQCQFVKAYDDDKADDEDSDTILSTQRFVTFRLCPNCGSCNYKYGEYIVDLETYLEATVQYYQEEQQQYCKDCEECAEQAAADADADADANDGGRRLADCSTCYTTCQNIENMEQNGYRDASEYINCAQMGNANDDGSAYYVGPMCSNGGSKIKIGVFTDNMCSEFAEEGVDIDTIFAAEADAENDANAQAFQLSYHLLKKVHDSDSCISCGVEEEDADADANGNAEVQQVCENLYAASGKCEYTHKMETGYENYDGFANQVANEKAVCGFINAVNSGAYGEDGEITVSSSNVSVGGGRATTGAQKFFLSFFIIGTVGLVAYAGTLYSKLTKTGQPDLSSSDGAMA